MVEWSSPYAGWVYFSVATGFVALVAVARRMAISDRLRSWLLFVPRVLALTLLVVILLNPVWKRELHLPPQPAQVDFLVDASRSMAFDQPISRANHVQAVIQGLDDRLKDPARARVQLYRFGERLSSASDLAALRPSDDASRLAEALEQLPQRFSRIPPKAVVVFSDGAVDDAQRLADVAAGFRRMHVPIHVYPSGGTQLRGDVAIDELVLPPRAEAGAKVPLHGTVRGTGYEGERVVLQVKPAGSGNSPPLAALPITLSEKPQPFEFVVEANPDYGELVLEVPPLPGEVTTQNNRVPFQLAAARRKLKVIYMEGTGGNEVHWVRDALLEDKDIECLAMVADQQYVQRPRLQRVDDAYRGFPATREELLQYDCVICSDISLGAFTKEQLDWTVELVAERGGGFAMVGGITSFGAGGWDQTVWDKLIPIDMAGGNLGRGWLYHQFQVKIPEEAQNHPIWRIVEDPQQNRQVLATMPPFLGTNYMQRLKPAATPLAYSAESIPNIGGIMPVFAAQPYGRGRTFAFAPDTTADWGRYFESQWGVGDNRYFRRFWRNLVRWLSENSTMGNKRLEIETDRIIYRAGEPIVVTARAYDEKLQQTVGYDLTAQVRSVASPNPNSSAAKGPAAKDKTAKSSSDAVSLAAAAAAKIYSGQIDSQALVLPEDGSGNESQVVFTREVDVVARDGGKEIARASAKVQILPDLREFRQPRPRPEILEQLARDADGRVLRFPGDIEFLMSELTADPGDSITSRQPLWDSPWLWLAILVLLTFEWSLRRRAGYG
jgi:uncharacterized membrane protein